MPPAIRGRYVTILSALTNLAVVAVGFAGLWIIPTIGWRYMFAIIGVAAGIVWVHAQSHAGVAPLAREPWTVRRGGGGAAADRE